MNWIAYSNAIHTRPFDEDTKPRMSLLSAFTKWLDFLRRNSENTDIKEDKRNLEII